MAAYVWIGVYFGAWWHVWISALIAPLMLLRTEHSAERGWQLAKRLDRSLGSGLSNEWRDLLRVSFVALLLGCLILGADAGAILYVLLIAVVLMDIGYVPPIAGRVAGAFVGFFDLPRRSIDAIPGNWWRLSACTDFRVSPELIPFPSGVEPASGHKDAFLGEATHPSTYHAWGTVSSHYKHSRSNSDTPIPVEFILTSPMLVFAIIPSIAFRLSIKATSIIWLPLLWAVRPPKPADEPWSAHIRLKATDDLTRIVVLLSVVSLALAAAKIVLFVAEYRLAIESQAWHNWLGKRLGDFAVALVRPGEIPIWQIASTVNASFAIIVFLLLRHWLRRGEVGLVNNEPRIERTLAVFYFFRRLLSTYTIGNQLVVFYLLARELPLPMIGSKFFPWL